MRRMLAGLMLLGMAACTVDLPSAPGDNLATHPYSLVVRCGYADTALTYTAFTYPLGAEIPGKWVFRGEVFANTIDSAAFITDSQATFTVAANLPPVSEDFGNWHTEWGTFYKLQAHVWEGPDLCRIWNIPNTILNSTVLVDAGE